MNSGNSTDGAWPGSETYAGGRLPRVADLPAAADGCDREGVRAAFDSFHRHIAQLDSTLRALEAVEVFREQAGELRRELRALKAAGWAQQPSPTHAPPRESPGVPESLPRFALEAAFLVVAAVVVTIAGFDRLSIVLVMMLAWSIVGVVEWAASREPFERRVAPVPRRPHAEPAGAPLDAVAREPAGAVAASRAPRMTIAAAVDEAHTLVRGGAEAPAAPQQPDGVEPQQVVTEHPPALDERSGHDARSSVDTRDADHDIELEGDGEAPDREPEVVFSAGDGRSKTPLTPEAAAEAPRRRGRGPRPIALAALVAVALPAGIAPGSLVVAGEKRPDARTAVVRAKPRSLAPEAFGRPTRDTAPVVANAVVRASRGDSWVEVRVSSPEGKELYAGMLLHGRFVRARSERLWVRLGAASNVDLHVNGKPIERLFGTVAVQLTPHGVAAG